MNAVEFVKKYGFLISRELLNECPKYCDYLSDKGFYKITREDQLTEHHVKKSDLKILLDQYWSVMEHGSIERAKKYAESPYTAPEIKDVLLKAIEMVEIINEDN